MKKTPLLQSNRLIRTLMLGAGLALLCLLIASDPSLQFHYQQF
ncbi:MAG: hypothetical protein ACFE0K_01465 [Alcanivorax sp.]